MSPRDDQLNQLNGDGAGLSPETAEVLRRARLGAPMPQLHKRRLKGALLAKVAVASTATLAAGQAAGQATAAAMGMSLAAKVVVGLAVVGSIGAGVTLAVRPARPHVERALHVAPARVERVEHVEHVEIEAPPLDPSVAVVAAPPRAPARHAPARHAAAAPVSTLAEETSLLREADKALRAGDTATALARLDEDAARFPHGALAPERAAERLLVLCEVGAADPKAIGQFLTSHSGSPLAARVRRACAAKP